MAGESIPSEGPVETISNEQREESRQKLGKWLNKSMKITMTDGRTLVGIFLCTDSDCNIIMGSCEEYLKPVEHIPKEEPRILGLAMIPGKHVVSIEFDESSYSEDDTNYFDDVNTELPETMPKIPS